MYWYFVKAHKDETDEYDGVRRVQQVSKPFKSNVKQTNSLFFHSSLIFLLFASDEKRKHFSIAAATFTSAPATVIATAKELTKT